MATEHFLISKDHFDNLIRKANELDKKNIDLEKSTVKVLPKEIYHNKIEDDDEREKTALRMNIPQPPPPHPQVMILTTHQSQKVEWVSLLNKMELMLCLIMGIMSILLMMSMELWR